MTNPRSADPVLLTTEDLATYLGVPRSTLYGWKYRGDGPPAIRVGRHLRYRSSEVQRWLDGQTQSRELT
jgi:excisionase family DNA binding protein